MKRLKPRRGRRDGHRRYIALEHYLMNSPAWATLDPLAKVLLLEVWKRHNGINNGDISYSTREAAEELCMSNASAARALQRLIDRGFLVCTRASAFTVKTRAARLWRITAEPCGGNPATKDFMRWRPPANSLTGETVNAAENLEHSLISEASQSHP